MSDSDRTITQEPRPFLWTEAIIETIIEAVKEKDLELERKYPPLTGESDSEVIYWAHKLGIDEVDIARLHNKVQRVQKSYKQRLADGVATRKDSSLKLALQASWAKLVLALKRKTDLYNRVCERALTNPVQGDCDVLADIEKAGLTRPALLELRTRTFYELFVELTLLGSPA